MNQIRMNPLAAAECVPRKRGDEPEDYFQKELQHMCSPQARG